MVPYVKTDVARMGGGRSTRGSGDLAVNKQCSRGRSGDEMRRGLNACRNQAYVLGFRLFRVAECFSEKHFLAVVGLRGRREERCGYNFVPRLGALMKVPFFIGWHREH